MMESFDYAQDDRVRRFPLLHAICTPLTGLADFRRKKARKALQLPLHNPQPKAGSKRERWDKARAKSLDAATIKISVAFYK